MLAARLEHVRTSKPARSSVVGHFEFRFHQHKPYDWRGQECAHLGRSAEGRRNSEADLQVTGRIDCVGGQWMLALVVTPETMGVVAKI